ncbi:MAG: hypothetical protein GVY08_03980 [Bacteroidetes bacterium]|jgi:uncharacterized GH25 family protein|nr:hypothetical protein [Bacteroidota bacterium]
MRTLSSIIFVVIAILGYGCTSNQTSFEDSIPLFTLNTDIVPEGAGTIEPNEGEFSTGENITITASPAEGFVFERWEGDLNGNTNPETLIFSGDRSVTAHFTEKTFDLTIEIVGEGVVRETILSTSGENESDSVATGGSTVRLDAEPGENWEFSRWEGDLTGNNNPETIVVDSEKNVTAIFDRSAQDGFSISIDIIGEGTVQKEPDRNNFADGEEVTLTAVADSGWVFIEWRGDLSGQDSSQTITISDDVEATAVFALPVDPSIEIIQQPSETVAGESISPAPQVRHLDEFEEPIEGAEIRVNLNTGSFTTNSSTSAVTNSQGIATFDDLQIEDAGTGYVLLLSVDDDDTPQGSSQPFDIVPAAPAPAGSSAEVPNGTAGEPTDISISINDSFGNPVPGVADAISLSISGSNSASPEVSGTGDGIYMASYTPTTAGIDRIEIEINGEPISGSPFSSTVGPGLPDEILIITQPSSGVAGESLVPAPSVRVLDRFDNRLESVDVEAGLSSGEFITNSTIRATTNAGGVASFGNLSIAKASEGYTIEFSAGDVSKNSDPFSIRPGPVDFSLISATVPDGETGQELRISVTLTDSFDNFVSDAENRLSAEVRGANNLDLPFDEASGGYETQYVPVNRGTDRVNIRFDNRPVGGSPFSRTIEAADAGPSASEVSASPSTLQADETAEVTVEVRDRDDNPIGGLEPSSFEINVTGNAATGNIAETSTPGTYRFNVTNSTVETVEVSVRVNGVLLSDRPEITFEVGDPHEMVIITQPEDTKSGEPVEGPPTVRVFDEGGRPVPDVEVTVREQNNTPFASGTLMVDTDGSGTAVFDDLVFETNLRFLNLVFSADGVDDVTSNRFVVRIIGIDTD